MALAYKYILDGHIPVPCDDVKEWANWYENADRRVRKDEFGDIVISTVFLGLDHSFGHGAPKLFETMVFGGALDKEMVRYATWDEADNGHNAMIERVVAALIQQ